MCLNMRKRLYLLRKPGCCLWSPRQPPQGQVLGKVQYQSFQLPNTVFYLPNNWEFGFAVDLPHHFSTGGMVFGLIFHHTAEVAELLGFTLMLSQGWQSFILPLLQHLQLLLPQWSIRTRPNGRPSGWDIVENRTLYQLPTACACHWWPVFTMVQSTSLSYMRQLICKSSVLQLISSGSCISANRYTDVERHFRFLKAPLFFTI